MWIHRTIGALRTFLLAAAIVNAYDLPASTRLLRTGTPLNDRKLRQMDVVARKELSNLTGEEIAEIHAYLVKRAQQAP